MSQPAAGLHRFPGGLKLEAHKRQSTAQPIRTLPPPAEVVLPLDQHIGETAIACVEVGQRVRRGQPVARAEALICAPVHASISGRVVAIEPRPLPHPDGLEVTAVVIESDGEDEPSADCRPIEGWSALSSEALIERIREAGIVGLGGAAFPTSVKLTRDPAHEPIALVLNGAECEPYISCDEVLMRERAEAMLLGARVMMQALQVERCLVAVERDKPEALASLREALERAADPRFELVEIEAIYPAGGERQLLQMLSGREVPYDGLPIDIGYVCHNVGTAAAVAQLVTRGEPLISRIVTVTGPGVRAPANLEVRIGTAICQLIEACGGYSDEVARLIVGGPMMGFALPGDDLPVIKATNCVLAATGAQLRPEDDALPCIRCGECARVCPAVLLPQQLYWHARVQAWDRAVTLGIRDCIECGCCDYVCPSHIPLARWFSYAKSEIAVRQLERRKAERARRRHDQRERRQSGEEAERLRKLEARKRAAGATHIAGVESDAIRKVMERVEARKRSRGDKDAASDDGEVD